MDENKTVDPKLSEALYSVWDSLTDEQKEKAKACKTVGNLTELAAKEGIELPDELLDAVAGGYIFWEAQSGNWEVIRDRDGEVLGRYHGYGSEGAAREDARSRGQQDTVISWADLKRLRSS